MAYSALAIMRGAVIKVSNGVPGQTGKWDSRPYTMIIRVDFLRTFIEGISSD